MLIPTGALDFIAKKEGPSKVKLASQDLKRIWKMKPIAHRLEHERQEENK